MANLVIFSVKGGVWRVSGSTSLQYVRYGKSNNAQDVSASLLILHLIRGVPGGLMRAPPLLAVLHPYTTPVLDEFRAYNGWVFTSSMFCELRVAPSFSAG